jgi:hypothetical protein
MGCIGLFVAAFLQLFTISTLNFQAFSELAFSFTLTFESAWKSLLFSPKIGLAGGVISGLPGSQDEYSRSSEGRIIIELSLKLHKSRAKGLKSFLLIQCVAMLRNISIRLHECPGKEDQPIH